jgi:ribosomal protein S18 acetylase RimI-like enzyme
VEILIREAQSDDLDALQNFTVRAFEPVFASFALILGRHLYDLVYPDWKSLQSNLVLSLYNNEKINVRVADGEGKPIGFIAYQFQEEDKTGVIEFLVVDPDYQNDGIGTRLNEFALEKMVEAGMKVALVGTGGDESHAPARKAYEKAGFIALPSVWYFKSLV